MPINTVRARRRAGRIGSPLRWVAVVIAMTQLSMARGAAAQQDGPDASRIALVYHKLTHDPLDVRAAAERTDAVRHASTFDRPDVVTQEAARLQASLDGADPSAEFTMTINDQISQYDHDAAEFSIVLFEPGYYVPVNAFGQQYKVVFANAESARAIAMAKDEARTFDARLNGMGRSVMNEIHFRVIGQGDPAGAVTGLRVVRAQIISARITDRAGHVLFVPTIAAPAMANAPGAGRAAPPPFDAAALDVAGFRVGVKATDLGATLQRTVGTVTRAPAGRNAFPGLTGSLSANGDGCFSYPGRRNNPRPGAVCVTAFYDRDGIVRSVRVERLFPWLDAEVFRKTLVQRYGPVAGAQSGSVFTLGWGPPIDTALVYDRSGPRTALTARWEQNDDAFGGGLNSLANIRIVLQLVDATWAKQQVK